MYQQFFGLRERPFELTPNPRFLVLTESHREVLSNLEYGIAGRVGLALVIGEAGSGKTTLIRTAIERQRDNIRTVYLNNPTLTRGEFVEMLATRFDLSQRARESKTALLVELENRLLDRQKNLETSILVVDEAQSLPTDLLEEIRLLANLETNDTRLVMLVLAGQPELSAKLDSKELRQLKQRVSLRCELRTLTLGETAAYLAGRIRAAGGAGSQVFTREAVTLIHEHSAGIPRVVNVIADNALLGGFALGQRPVSSAVVREVCRDFHYAGVPSPVSASVARARLGQIQLTSAPVVTPMPTPAPGATPAPPPLKVVEAPKSAPAPVPAPVPAAETANEATKKPADEPAPTQEPEGALFGSVSVKQRRRFTFFGQ